jgi:hypothetical protein
LFCRDRTKLALEFIVGGRLLLARCTHGVAIAIAA